MLVIETSLDKDFYKFYTTGARYAVQQSSHMSVRVSLLDCIDAPHYSNISGKITSQR